LSQIVVDASITLSWCFADEQTPLSLKVLERLKAGDQALVPFFWSLEVLNSLLVGERRGRISPEQTRAFLGDLGVLSPSFDHPSMEQINGPVQKLSRDHGLTPYDALYIELAMRTNCPLATQDQAQKNAAAAVKIECL
jgi:predicted nucleic acid-binding protein